MTDEELDLARAEKAYEMWPGGQGEYAGPRGIALIAARLAREGWVPEDPLLTEAREIAITAWDGINPGTVQSTRSGLYDKNSTVLAALAALRRGIEIGKASS